MDAHSFDRWTVALAQRPSRRTALRLLTGGLLGSLLASRGSGLVRAQADTDGDQLLDEDEINVYGTLPNNADTDGDQANDGLEIWNRDQGLGDPNDPLTPDNPAAPPPPDNGGVPPATCIALGGACSGMDLGCCQNATESVQCCLTDFAGASACTDLGLLGRFTCPDPAVPATGCGYGLTDCGGFCTDLSIDHGNCGACGHSCPFGSNCTLGACVQVCEPPLTNCSGVCLDTTNDFFNCGQCNRVCREPGEDELISCQNGQCMVITRFW